MKRVKRPRKSGVVVLDYPKLKQLLINQGWSETEFAGKLGISTHTMTRISSGKGVRPATAKLIASYFQKRTVDILVLGQIGTEARANGYGTIQANNEWEIAEEIGPWEMAFNGLEYRIVRLVHREIPERWARGKCYRLAQLSTEDERQSRERFIRHPKVCQLLRGQPQIATNLSVFKENGGLTWWVIDEWVAGRSMLAALQVGPLPSSIFGKIMRDVAMGIRALHGVAVIRRDLAPRNILIRQGDSGVVLTDFELSKLLDGAPTVASDWPDDPYRAPEVLSPSKLDLDGRADIYSWARVLVHAGCGRLPAKDHELPELKRLNLPQAIHDVVAKCLSLPCNERPRDIEVLLKALDQWV